MPDHLVVFRQCKNKTNFMLWVRFCPLAAENSLDDLLLQNDFLIFQGTMTTFFRWDRHCFNLVIWIFSRISCTKSPILAAGGNVPWFMCWLWHYINCLCVYLTSFLTCLLPYLLLSLFLKHHIFTSFGSREPFDCSCLKKNDYCKRWYRFAEDKNALFF